MGLTSTDAQRHFRRRTWGPLSPESMDIETCVGEAILRCPELEAVLDVDWVADGTTAYRVGWFIVKYPGVTFRIGRRLLELAAPDGYPMPPLEFQMSRETEPTAEEMYHAPILQPWSLVLFQSGERPAEWQLSGIVYHPKWPCTTDWFRLLYLHRDKRMAFTDQGWFKLGRRFAS
ncbi:MULTISPECIES: hypothetical protein [Rhizobium]|uniref:hypothetical protein n=1 Tax=Rhizobium TaxID=379 RepID=UPI000403919E|nr:MULTISPECIES: hypothetical protein [Rhizobium]UFS81518.1 hypothetical protein LPB79_24925 [Rhizobium sp. T136]